MVNVQKQFEKAADIVRSADPNKAAKKPSQDQQLAFYSHYKQGTEGDCTGAAPGAFNFTAKYKYNAWKKLEGMSKEDAQLKYIELFKAGLEDASAEDKAKCLAALEAAGQE